ncbi:unnamed protein product [Symbiodinium natans]|uniref:Uncharacterized protein n=1 Tax=Symbiodinium natans TaxID=878477 RepID=A0A812TPE3_9DINO|nr:unnamed protein product [Symbiodinium natans]
MVHPCTVQRVWEQCKRRGTGGMWMGTTIFQPVQPGSVVLRPRLESKAFVHLGSSILHSPPRAPLNTSIYSFACKVAMAVIDTVPSLEELSLADVCGQQCMPGIETNLARWARGAQGGHSLQDSRETSSAIFHEQARKDRYHP